MGIDAIAVDGFAGCNRLSWDGASALFLLLNQFLFGGHASLSPPYNPITYFIK
jgi:hypothetical protein